MAYPRTPVPQHRDDNKYNKKQCELSDYWLADPLLSNFHKLSILFPTKIPKGTYQPPTLQTRKR